MIAKAGKRSFSNYKSAALPTELCRQCEGRSCVLSREASPNVPLKAACTVQSETSVQPLEVAGPFLMGSEGFSFERRFRVAAATSG